MGNREPLLLLVQEHLDCIAEEEAAAVHVMSEQCRSALRGEGAFYNYDLTIKTPGDPDQAGVTISCIDYYPGEVPTEIEFAGCILRKSNVERISNSIVEDMLTNLAVEF